jgi:hypothetical protein
MIAAKYLWYSHDNTVEAFARNRNSIQVLQSLIDARADITARVGGFGNTALCFAVRRKNHGATAFLQNLGAPM